MSYDWSQDGSSPRQPELAWFDDQDRRAIATHRHFADDKSHFDRIIPFDQLAGKEVLEIGVGSGLHSELLARAGALLTGIDLTERAIEITQRRFDLKGLAGTFEPWDAEITRKDWLGRFDFVWSWGVIHHSAHTARIVRNVSTWLADAGRFSGMVYHRDSMQLAIALARDWIIHHNIVRHSVDEALWANADGFTARYYPADQWRDLLYAFFAEASVSVSGSDGDLVPLPAPISRLVAPRISVERKNRVVSRIGGWLLFDAANPIR
jgi:SAM-dependent methyltransferase